MDLKRLTNDQAAHVTGVVVVIDVIRAFTTAACALAAGARDIVLTDTVENAFALRDRFAHLGFQGKGVLVMGEVNGIQVPEFDLGNSPAALAGVDLAGRRLIQRTTAGTQGVVLSSAGASILLACSLCVAGATARYIQQLGPKRVTFVITGARPGDKWHTGDEDAACADYVESLLRGETPDKEAAVRRVLDSPNGRAFLDPAHPQLPVADLAYCTDIERFDFAMRVVRQDNLLVMRPVQMPKSPPRV